MKVVIQPEQIKAYKKGAAAKERPVQRDVRQGWAAGACREGVQAYLQQHIWKNHSQGT